MGCLGIKVEGAWVVLIHEVPMVVKDEDGKHTYDEDGKLVMHPEWIEAWDIGRRFYESGIARAADTVSHRSCEAPPGIATVDKHPVVTDERTVALMYETLRRYEER